MHMYTHMYYCLFVCVCVIVLLNAHRAVAETQAEANPSQRTPSSLQRLNTTLLMQNLSIDTDGDLKVIVTRAERIKPKICLDVLDPQEAAAKVIAEFETF